MCKKIFSLKKRVILSLIILIILIVCIFSIIMLNNHDEINKKDNNVYQNQNDINNIEEIEEDEEEVMPNNQIDTSEKDDIGEDKTSDISNEDNTNSTIKNNESTDNEISSDNEVSENNDFDNSENNNEISKTVCSNSDTEYATFISNYKVSNPTYFIFDTLNEAKQFGENAMIKYGYAYEYNDIPEIFSGSNCIKEIWYVRLIIPAKECTLAGSDVYNEKMYLPATSKDNLVNYFDYLRGQGYDCGNKQWFY